MILLTLGGCPGSEETGGPAGTTDLVLDLENLEPSPGALSPSFDATTDSYQVIVNPTTGQVFLTATVTDARASLTINGQPAASGQPFGPIALQPGTNPPIPVVVEALGLEKQYNVVIERTTTAHLQSLVASAGPLVPAFDPEKLAYTVTTETTTTSTTITATLVDPTALLTINGAPAVSGQPSPAIPLAFGPTQIPVRVQAQDGKSKDYVVTVIRPVPDCSTSLNSLTINQGSLSPNFDPSTENYSVAVGSGVGSLMVTAGAVTNAIVKINGQTTSMAQVPLNPGGQSTTITIEVQCPDGTAKTYTIRVDREAPCNSNLTNLTISQGQLSPAFNPNQTSYQVNVGDAVGQVTVTATPAAGSSVSINGQTTNTLAVNLNPAGQSTTITIVVQCPDGSTKTYTITVNRAPTPCSTNLTNLTLAGGKVPISFGLSVLNYTVTVGSTVGSLAVVATKQDTNATVEINGQFTSSLEVTLGAPGTSSTIQIVVRCQDGTSKTYRVTVNRLAGNATLSSLKVTNLYSGGCVGFVTDYLLTPPFSPLTENYTVNVGASATSVCVTVTKAEAGQTVTINGQATTSRIVPLGAAGTSTIIGIVVTAADGVSQMQYVVTVNRATASTNNFLANLELRENGATQPVTLTPAFNGRNTFSYNAQDCCGTINYRITATAEDSTATLRYRVNAGAFQPLSSGFASALITFSCCSVHTIVVEVTAQNGQVRNYSISFQIVD